MMDDTELKRLEDAIAAKLDEHSSRWLSGAVFVGFLVALCYLSLTLKGVTELRAGLLPQKFSADAGTAP